MSKDKQKKEAFDLVLETNSVQARSKQKKPTKLSNISMWYYLGFVGEIGFSIALPIAGGALLGGYIDSQLASYPRATLSLLFLGIILSLVTFIRTIQALINKDTKKEL